MNGLRCIKSRMEYECLAKTIIQSDVEEGIEPTTERTQNWIEHIDNMLYIQRSRSLMMRKNGLKKDLTNYLLYAVGKGKVGQNQDFVNRKIHRIKT